MNKFMILFLLLFFIIINNGIAAVKPEAGKQNVIKAKDSKIVKSKKKKNNY